MKQADGDAAAPADLRRLEASTRHKCPPWCHRCPILRAVMQESGTGGSDTMPGCYGGAHDTPCTCGAERAAAARKKRDSARLSQVEARLAALEAAKSPASTDR